MEVTKFVLKKPVTALLIIVSVIFFGIVSFSKFKYELMPDVNMPMYIVATIYPGASPEDVDKNVTKKTEDAVNNLTGIKSVQAVSRENMSLVVAQYNYDTNMDIAYNDLKKALDQIKTQFDDSVEDAIIVEMDMNAMASLTIAVNKEGTEDLYNYVQNTFVKEIEKVSDVASVYTSGGREKYIKISLKPEMLARYNLDISTLASIIKAADFTYPAGSIKNADRDLSVSTSVEYKTVESLKSIPIITGNKRTLYLEDLADVRMDRKEATTAGRYDSKDCIVVSVQKNQSSSEIALSKNVRRVIKNMVEQDSSLQVTIVKDGADTINLSIKNVFETMIMAIVLSMFIIFVFFEDIKASLIVGTSIPFSILVSLVCMYLAGYSLNIVTLSALVAGVGMMVDNSIVVLEACFRAKEIYTGEDLKSYIKTAIRATQTVGFSVFGSTLTTCVVFAPLIFIAGMTGQFFKPLGFTIVFCMMASFVSSVSIVPLCYIVYKPREKDGGLMSKIMSRVRRRYRAVIGSFLRHKPIIVIGSILLLASLAFIVPSFKTELVPACDEGMVRINIQTKPSQTLEARLKTYTKFENFVMAKDEVDHYCLSNSAGTFNMSGGMGGGQSLICYLKDKKDRKKTTKQIANEWIKELGNMTDCTYEVESYGTSITSSFVMDQADKFDKYIESKDLDELKKVDAKIRKELEKRNDLSDISTYLDKGAPTIKIKVDPILAAAEGFTPALVGQQLNYMISGMEIKDMNIYNETYTMNLEYENDEYNDINKVESILLTSPSGSKIPVRDIAKIAYSDSAVTINKYNKMYRDQIKAYYNINKTKDSEKEILENIIKPNLTKNVSIGKSALDEHLNEEFGSLFTAIIVAIFLVFLVMASQFENTKYSLLVMITILFSFVGALWMVWFAGVRISMPTLLSLMLLIGTAVNNGILYVDTANQYIKEGNEKQESIIEAGAIRIRPMCMTTFTTMVSVIPMALGYGENGELLQSLGLVNIGGLLVSTVSALFILPVFYAIFNKDKESILVRISKNSPSALKEYANEEDSIIDGVVF